MDFRCGRTFCRSWASVAEHVQILLGQKVSAAACEASSCKLLQMLSSSLAGASFSRAHRGEEEFRLGFPPFAEKLLRSAAAGLRGNDEEEEGEKNSRLGSRRSSSAKGLDHFEINMS